MMTRADGVGPEHDVHRVFVEERPEVGVERAATRARLSAQGAHAGDRNAREQPDAGAGGVSRAVTEDDAPGTVFSTDAHGVHTTWVILERTPLTAVYARVPPGVSAGTVTVTLRPDGEHTIAEVTYDLTSLGADLQPFADGFGHMLGEWERLIGEAAGSF